VIGHDRIRPLMEGCFIQSARGQGHLPARGKDYRRSTATAPTYWHFGHSNVRRFASGLSGSMRTTHIGVPHNGHGGRSLGVGESKWWVPGIATKLPQDGPDQSRARADG
jgi:hypothetical protein